MNYQELAVEVVRRALESGATDAECTISEGEEFSASVRMRELENLKEAGARGLGVRVLVGQRTGSAYTSDLTEDGIRAIVLPTGLVDVKVCAVNADWSGLKLMVRKEQRGSWNQ